MQKSFLEKYLQHIESVEMTQEYDDSADMMKEKIKRTINLFPDRQREIFKMSRIYKMTYKEMSRKSWNIGKYG